MATAIGGSESGRSNSRASSSVKCSPPVALVAAQFHSAADDVQRLAEHLVAPIDRRVASHRPTTCSLSRSQAQTDSVNRPSEGNTERGRLLGDDRRVVAQDRARHERLQHRSSKTSPGRRRRAWSSSTGNAAARAPTGGSGPNLDELEPRRLGLDGLADDLLGVVPLGDKKLVADLHLRSTTRWLIG